MNKRSPYQQSCNANSNHKKQGTHIDFKIFQSRSTVEKIVTFAKTKKIDLIVMGSHGRIGFDNLLLGSVANGVAQRVRCPILIVK